jgi:hypothetical protein
LRGIGCLFVAIVVLGGVLLIGDMILTDTAEERTATRISETLEADAQVDLQGWPVGLRMLLGSIPTATLSATDVPLDNGAVLDRLDVELTDVAITFDDLTTQSDRLPAAETGTFVAELDEASVAAMMGIPGGLAEVTLQDGLVEIGAGGLAIQADVGARDGDVVVSLAGPLAALLGGSEFAIDLSAEPGQPFVEEVEIDGGVMIVRGRLEEVRR